MEELIICFLICGIPYILEVLEEDDIGVRIFGISLLSSIIFCVLGHKKMTIISFVVFIISLIYCFVSDSK